MKELLSFTKKSFVFIIGFIIFVYFLEVAINFTVKQINVGEYGVLNRINAGTINADILISGSSRALKAINPQIITKETGISCFNIASDGSDLGVQLPKLKWYLNKNKKPKILIQDVSQFGGDISNTIYEPFKYLPYLFDESLYLGLSKIDSKFWLHRYVYPSNLIYYNFDFYSKLLQELYQTMNKEDQYTNGFLPDNSKWSSNFELYKKENPKGINCFISDEYVKYLNELKEYCEKQNIILIITVLPNYYLLNEVTKNADEVFEFYKSLENIPHLYYLNFVNSDIASDEQNFYNFTHLNLNGSSKFSNKLANYLLTFSTHQ